MSKLEILLLKYERRDSALQSIFVLCFKSKSKSEDFKLKKIQEIGKKSSEFNFNIASNINATLFLRV